MFFLRARPEPDWRTARGVSEVTVRSDVLFEGERDLQAIREDIPDVLFELPVTAVDSSASTEEQTKKARLKINIFRRSKKLSISKNSTEKAKSNESGSTESWEKHPPTAGECANRYLEHKNQPLLVEGNSLESQKRTVFALLDAPNDQRHVSQKEAHSYLQSSRRPSPADDACKLAGLQKSGDSLRAKHGSIVKKEQNITPLCNDDKKQAPLKNDIVLLARTAKNNTESPPKHVASAENSDISSVSEDFLRCTSAVSLKNCEPECNNSLQKINHLQTPQATSTIRLMKNEKWIGKGDCDETGQKLVKAKHLTKPFLTPPGNQSTKENRKRFLRFSKGASLRADQKPIVKARSFGGAIPRRGRGLTSGPLDHEAAENVHQMASLVASVEDDEDNDACGGIDKGVNELLAMTGLEERNQSANRTLGNSVKNCRDNSSAKLAISLQTGGILNAHDSDKSKSRSNRRWDSGLLVPLPRPVCRLSRTNSAFTQTSTNRELNILPKFEHSSFCSSQITETSHCTQAPHSTTHTIATPQSMETNSLLFPYNKVSPATNRGAAYRDTLSNHNAWQPDMNDESWQSDLAWKDIGHLGKEVSITCNDWVADFSAFECQENPKDNTCTKLGFNESTQGCIAQSVKDCQTSEPQTVESPTCVCTLHEHPKNKSKASYSQTHDCGSTVFQYEFTQKGSPSSYTNDTYINVDSAEQTQISATSMQLENNTLTPNRAHNAVELRTKLAKIAATGLTPEMRWDRHEKDTILGAADPTTERHAVFELGWRLTTCRNATPATRKVQLKSLDFEALSTNLSETTEGARSSAESFSSIYNRCWEEPNEQYSCYRNISQESDSKQKSKNFNSSNNDGVGRRPPIENRKSKASSKLWFARTVTTKENDANLTVGSKTKRAGSGAARQAAGAKTTAEAAIVFQEAQTLLDILHETFAKTGGQSGLDASELDNTSGDTACSPENDARAVC